MGKQLVICEKPSVATDVAKALKAKGERFERRSWGFESANWAVTAAAGHLLAEAPPQDYDSRYKTWTFEDLPILPDPFTYQPRDDRAAQRLADIDAVASRPDVVGYVNACDAGREGELIFKLVLAHLSDQTKPVQRAWFASMTTDAICEAFDNLRPDAEMAGLEAAARCRSEADWYVGMNGTRAATLTLGGGRMTLTVGRVQTPTLAVVVRRDLEIDNFVPKDFFRVRAQFEAENGAYTGWWYPGEGTDARFDTVEEADALVSRVRTAKTATVSSVEVTQQRSRAPKLFDLTELQREANRRFGISAAQTLVAAQACYETHKVLSYPRTDSRFLTADMEPLIEPLLQRVADAVPDLAAHIETAKRQEGGLPTSKLINDAKVNDHHGLIPTNTQLDLSPLSADERKIFDLVVRQFVAALLPDRTFEKTVIITDVTPTEGDLVTFKSSGKLETDAGWNAVFSTVAAASDDKPDEEDADTVCPVTDGEQVSVAQVERTKHTTKPPARFNEASLLGAMATAGRLVEDDEAADAMKDSGLGTPATRASILEALLRRTYLERQGRKLIATAKGRGLIMALGNHPLVSPDLTGDWERRLKLLEREQGEAAEPVRAQFMDDMKAFSTEVVRGFEGRTRAEMAAGLRKLGECPQPSCDGQIVETAKAWACNSWKSAEEPGCGATFWKVQDGKKKTEAAARRWMKDVAAGKVVIVPPRPRVVFGPCPNEGCDGEVVSRRSSWGCNSWKSKKEPGCGYVLWATNPDGSDLTEEAARALYAQGKTNARERVVLGPCPTDGCDGEVVERAKSWSCDSWKSAKDPGCGYVIWRSTRDGGEVTTQEAAAMLAEGRTNARQPAAVLRDCPRCKGGIVERAKSWGCNSWKSKDNPGCGTVVWKSSRDSGELTWEQATELLDGMVGTKAPKPRAKKAAAKK